MLLLSFLPLEGVLLSDHALSDEYSRKPETGIASAQFERVTEVQKKYLGRIEVHTPEELNTVLKKVERVFDTKGVYHLPPVQIILFGAEAEVFVLENYRKYQQIVKLAAQLDALDSVDIQICENWMVLNGIATKDLIGFVGTVPNGPVAKEGLLGKGYVYF